MFKFLERAAEIENILRAAKLLKEKDCYKYEINTFLNKYTITIDFYRDDDAYYYERGRIIIICLKDEFKDSQIRPLEDTRLICDIPFN